MFVECTGSVSTIQPLKKKKPLIFGHLLTVPMKVDQQVPFYKNNARHFSIEE